MVLDVSLKNAIIDYAVKGQLGTHNKNDIPASKVIKQLEQQKTDFYTNNKVRKDKNTSEIFRREGSFFERIGNQETCIDKEVLFNIPENWEWTRLRNIGYWKSGTTPSRSKTEYYENGNINWIKTGDLNDGYITESSEKITSKALEECKTLNLFPKGSVVIAIYCAGTLGRLGILEEESTTNQACCTCQCFEGMYNKFLFYYLYSVRKQLTQLSRGTAQPNISKEILEQFLIPIPPIEEQHRIVEQIEKLLDYADTQMLLEEKTTLFKKQFRTSLLHTAVQGKLSAQDLNVEPAEQFIQQIQSQRAQLIKDKKLKQNPNEGVIYKKGNSFFERIGDTEVCLDKQIPFAIPETWTWARLYQVCYKMFSGTSAPKANEPTEFRMISVKNVINEGLKNLDDVRYVNEADFKKIDAKSDIQKGDVLLTIRGSVGRSMVYNEDFKLLFQAGIVVLGTYLNPHYLRAYLESNAAQTFMNQNTIGTALKGVNFSKIQELLIPVPPRAEQDQIVNSIQNYLEAMEAYTSN